VNFVHQRIIDLMFLGTILGNENVNTEGRAMRAEKTLNRKAASNKLLNWKADGKPWSELSTPFGWGLRGEKQAGRRYSCRLLALSSPHQRPKGLEASKGASADMC
jgi:hypothetical protein